MKKYFYIIFVLGILVGGIYFYYIGSNTIRANRGLSEGENYIKKMYAEYAIVGKVCQGKDTDGDGYISCDFRIKTETKEDVINLQCPTFISSYLGTSCKESRLAFPIR